MHIYIYVCIYTHINICTYRFTATNPFLIPPVRVNTCLILWGDWGGDIPLFFLLILPLSFWISVSRTVGLGWGYRLEVLSLILVGVGAVPVVLLVVAAVVPAVVVVAVLLVGVMSPLIPSSDTDTADVDTDTDGDISGESVKGAGRR